MDGSISIKFKNGEDKLFTNVTAINCHKLNGQNILELTEIGKPMEIIKREDIDTFMIW